MFGCLEITSGVRTSSEGPTMNDFVSLTLVVGAIFLRSGERGIMLDWFQASDP